MKVAVAGASGRVGASVTLALRRAGHQCVALERRDLVSSDRDLALAARLIDVAAVVNCAGAQDGTRDELELANVTVAGRLAALASSRGVASFVHVSSLVVRSSEAPGSAYAMSKVRAERALVAALAGTHTRLSLVRPGWIVSDNPQVTAQVAPRRGRQLVVEDFRLGIIVVDDLARLVVALAERPDDVVTAATDYVSIADVLHAVTDLWPAPVRTVSVPLARAARLATSLKALPLPDLSYEVSRCREQLGSWLPWRESLRRSVMAFTAHTWPR